MDEVTSWGGSLGVSKPILQVRRSSTGRTCVQVLRGWWLSLAGAQRGAAQLESLRWVVLNSASRAGEEAPICSLPCTMSQPMDRGAAGWSWCDQAVLAVTQVNFHPFLLVVSRFLLPFGGMLVLQCSPCLGCCGKLPEFCGRKLLCAPRLTQQRLWWLQALCRRRALCFEGNGELK